MPQPFTILEAVAAPIDPENVDTDQILPARFLKKPRDQAYGTYLFHDLRFADNGEEIKDFVLNRPGFRDCAILVANGNFGCGSSREGAVYALCDYGIRSIIAPSFADIFYNNCLRNGIVPVRLPVQVCTELRNGLKQRPGLRIVVDLEHQQVCDLRGAIHSFDIALFPRQLLLTGLDEIGLTLSMLSEVEKFECEYHRMNPWSLPS